MADIVKQSSGAHVGNRRAVFARLDDVANDDTFDTGLAEGVDYVLVSIRGGDVASYEDYSVSGAVISFSVASTDEVDVDLLAVGMAANK